MSHKKIQIIAGAITLLLLGGLLINFQRITPPPHLNDLNTGSMRDSLYAILLVCLFIFTASGLGTIVFGWLKFEDLSFTEKAIFSLPIGMAAMALGIFFIGLAGWIEPLHLILFLGILSLFSFKASVQFAADVYVNIKYSIRRLWNFSLAKKLILAIGIIALFLAFLMVFTPPWDYDGLMYHLQSPRLFIEAGKITPLYENWVSFYPFLWEMLYMLGMGLGSDIFARLIHFFTMTLLLTSTFVVGKKHFHSTVGWMAVAILVGIPILPLWGISTYTEMSLALFELLSVHAILSWKEELKSRWLVLAGIFQGFALGTKYSAIGLVIILTGVVLFLSLKQKLITKQGALKILASFLGPAVLIASPWYLKNLIWTGNPLYPFIFPQHGTDPLMLGLWLDYMSSFGTGKQILDYLLLPINIFIHHEKFATFMGSMEMPNPIFLVIASYPFVRKKMIERFGSIPDILACITILFLAAWAVGFQQIRFMLPAFPLMAILTGAICFSIYKHSKKPALVRSGVYGLIGGMVTATLIFMGMYMNIIRPIQLNIGTETKAHFLQRMVRDFSGIEYINDQLPEGSKVLLLWDARGYYCEKKCIPDIDQALWPALVEKYGTAENIIAHLLDQGITHVILSKEDASYFLEMHDENQKNNTALKYFLDVFLPRLDNEVYGDDWVNIYSISKPGK